MNTPDKQKPIIPSESGFQWARRVIFDLAFPSSIFHLLAYDHSLKQNHPEVYQTFKSPFDLKDRALALTIDLARYFIIVYTASGMRDKSPEVLNNLGIIIPLYIVLGGFGHQVVSWALDRYSARGERRK